MNKIYPEHPPRKSPFEEFLTSKADAVLYALGFWDIPDLLTLGKLNYALRHWFGGYRDKLWSFDTFAKHYVTRSRDLYKLCGLNHTIIYGEAVFRFMARGSWDGCTLEICTDLENIEALTHFLSLENYYCALLDLGSDRERRRDRVADLVRRTYRIDSMTWYFRGDKGNCEKDLEGFTFEFTKGRGRTSRAINVHLVRCEPQRHVLSRSITPYTCFVDGPHAVCAFAKSIFRHSKAMILNGAAYQPAGTPGGKIEVPGAPRPHVFHVVGGPPSSFTKYPFSETGPRYIGDDKCWILDREDQDPMEIRKAVRGKTFEVVDFRMLHDGMGTYMRVGEPFVLSSQFYHGLRVQGRFD